MWGKRKLSEAASSPAKPPPRVLVTLCAYARGRPPAKGNSRGLASMSEVGTFVCADACSCLEDPRMLFALCFFFFGFVFLWPGFILFMDKDLLWYSVMFLCMAVATLSLAGLLAYFGCRHIRGRGRYAERRNTDLPTQSFIPNDDVAHTFVAPSTPGDMTYPPDATFPPSPDYSGLHGDQPPAYDTLLPQDKGPLPTMALHSLGGPIAPYQMPSATGAMPPPPVVMGTEGTSLMAQVPPPPYEGNQDTAGQLPSSVVQGHC